MVRHERRDSGEGGFMGTQHLGVSQGGAITLEGTLGYTQGTQHSGDHWKNHWDHWGHSVPSRITGDHWVGDHWDHWGHSK